MQYQSYQHIERLGTTETEGILNGTVYIFPKIDGTNGTAYLGDDGIVHAGSRRRELTVTDDNAGFCAAVTRDENIRTYLADHPTHRLFMEWLVPHALRTYRDDAWRRYYVFDVAEQTSPNEPMRYLPYPEYASLLEGYSIECIPPLCVCDNPSVESIEALLGNNFYLLKKDAGIGEGIVIKNYEYRNPYGRRTWAKIVASEFKERKHKPMSESDKAIRSLEMDIAEAFVTRALIEKEKAKIELSTGGWSSATIPRLLGQVFHCIVSEEMWNIYKKFKPETVNFKQLYKTVVARTKQLMPELF